MSVSTAIPMKRSFFRGSNMRKMPRAEGMKSPEAIDKYILDGWMPKARFINKDTNIVAFGSCFAANIGRYLNSLGFDISTQKEGKAYVQKISDGLVNVFAIAQQFEWAWENRVPDVHLWHGWSAEDYGYDEEVRLETKRIFDEADVFILTFGLSEVWYDEPSGEVFWRAVPEDKYDSSRHKFRVATHAETVERIQRIYDLIRKHRPSASIVFTLSPVGLAATFRPVSAITADAVSKAKLRSAIDEVHTAAADDNFFYFPSHEAVKEAFETPFNVDRRHPAVHVIETNMKAFEYHFCDTGMTVEAYHEAVNAALHADEVSTRGEADESRKIAQENRDRWKAENRPAASAESSVRKREKVNKRELALAQKRADREALIAQKKEARMRVIQEKTVGRLLSKKPKDAQSSETAAPATPEQQPTRSLLKRLIG